MLILTKFVPFSVWLLLLVNLKNKMGKNHIVLFIHFIISKAVNLKNFMSLTLNKALETGL